jgi:3-carboxy-cis,cis-muconate cycloisomerase
MSNLLWPGDERAGDLFSDETLMAAMIAVEEAWLDALAKAGVAPANVAKLDLQSLVKPYHQEWLENEAESTGNPAAGLVELLRSALADTSADGARWLHRGLTSQDVVDTALMLCAKDAVGTILDDLRRHIRGLADLVVAHRHTPMVGRTLTQHAVPTTFGLKAAGWLTGVLDAHDTTSALVLPVQVGGAAGTMAATVQLAGRLEDPVSATTALSLEIATALGLTASTPWHTTRTSVTRLGDAATACTDAWGRIATDVLTLSRSEIGELSEGLGGGSSTMPHKANPVLSSLVRRAALAAAQLAATRHLAAADAGDERPAGAWHAEWDTLRTLLRRTVVAGAQTTELLSGLQVHADRMAATLDAARDDVRSEQRAMADLSGTDATSDYLGATDAFLEAPLARAAGVLA